ncbi:citrate synthase/methylcitrate synthase [Sulfurisphaera ohwakuensis]|uniref:Citrate synthase n=1 Tax=Sulfurisphaera ohwakuensis TaxID=69656 RepID=A0A650CEH2_SULOH|nr:citrate synthase/methylcitrate synthase [Sulfurisphaera ohwakuensis]MBB5252822.1 citrate synthase [Sulfurisphaera ohwakuensis]QGR16241.1 citrate synthase [Sulfurisphaera ohwakuensis]
MEIKKGLEDVYVKETEITYIDGELGRLYYRGYSIYDLAEFSNFEEVSYLILYGKLPNREELNWFQEKLREERYLPDFIIKFLREVRKDAQPMDILRTAVSLLGIEDSKNDERTDIRGIKLISKFPTIVANYARLRKGLDIIEPDPKLSHSENFLYMLYGDRPNEIKSKAMDVTLILHIDHEMNASTFASLVVASTLSDLYSSIVAGISALKGPLHGGANYEALKMFKEIGSPEKVNDYILNRLSNKQRIMGFGHRVYKTYDPRARILKQYAKLLAEKEGGEIYTLYQIAEKVEEIGIKYLGPKGIYPNVDFFSSIVFYSLGFEPDFFPAVFASARVVGWVAHIMEYIKDNKIIRPKAYYKGEIGKKYIPIDSR